MDIPAPTPARPGDGPEAVPSRASASALTRLTRLRRRGAGGAQPAAVQLAGATKIFGSSVALEGLHLVVAPGEFVFVVGPSGSGKSTLLRLLLREQVADSGSVAVFGVDLTRAPRHRLTDLRRQVGVVFQDYRLLPDRTVAENVAYALRVLGAPRRNIERRTREALELVGLVDFADRMPTGLSGGEQQRVAIARAIVTRPRMLVADEPTGNLDPGNTAEIVELLDRVNAAGTTVVMATHDAALVDAKRRRVVELVNGQLVRDESAGSYTAGEALA